MEKVATEEERYKCQMVADVFRELYEKGQFEVVDGGGRGYGILYYRAGDGGSDKYTICKDGETLFSCLWEEWQKRWLEHLGFPAGAESLGHDKRVGHLTEVQRKELKRKKEYFANMAGFNMEEIEYFTKQEREKCEKVKLAFAEFCRTEGIVIVDAGRYGYVKLQNYIFPEGFDSALTFTDGKKLMESLWNDWLTVFCYNEGKRSKMEDMEPEEILRHLPREKKRKVLEMRNYFAEAAGIE